jgi:membrane associated rhomboid family serine protease
MILPIGHQERSVRRLPWVTIILIVSCFGIFLLTDTSVDYGEEEALAFEEAADHWRERAHLEAPPEIREHVAYDVMPNQRSQYLATLPDYSPYPPESPEHLAMQQAEFDRLVDVAFGNVPKDAASVTPFERWGVIPSAPRPLTFLTYMFIHAGWMHLVGNLFMLFLAGPPIEDRFGRAGFAAFYLTAGIFAGAFHMALSGGSAVPMVGASGAIAGVLGAFLVRLWNTQIRFAYFFLVLLRPIYGTFEAPAWAMLTLWFVNEMFQAWLWDSVGVEGGVAYWAHVGGFAFGVGATFALRAARYEERFVDPSIEAQITKFTANPVLEEAMDLRERGEVAQAFSMLQDEWERAPDEPIAVAFWDAALACAQPEIAAPALASAVQSAVKNGEHELALRHWSELSDHVPAALVSPAILLRFVPVLLEENQRDRAVLALRQAVDPGNTPLTPGQAQRVLEMARELDPPTAVRAARSALASPDLHESKREKLLTQIEELGGDAAAEGTAEGTAEATGAAAEPAPVSVEEDLPWGEDGAIDLARFGQVKLTEAQPVALEADGLRLQLGGDQQAHVGWDRIQAVSAAILDGLGPKPVLVIDLLANWSEPQAESLHGVRLRSDSFDPRRLFESDRDPTRAFGQFVGRLLELSQAQPLPTPENATGNPFARYDSADDYARIVLEVAD